MTYLYAYNALESRFKHNYVLNNSQNTHISLRVDRIDEPTQYKC